MNIKSFIFASVLALTSFSAAAYDTRYEDSRSWEDEYAAGRLEGEADARRSSSNRYIEQVDARGHVDRTHPQYVRGYWEGFNAYSNQNSRGRYGNYDRDRYDRNRNYNRYSYDDDRSRYEQVCQRVRVAVPVNDGRYRDDYVHPNQVLGGAIVGGLIGNQIGDGDGRRAATVIGALIGANAQKPNSGRNVHYRTVRQCYTVDTWTGNIVN